MKLDKLILWSQKEFSTLPWRKERTLYRTLVSEIMLQQTNVTTVKNHFDRFLVKYPTLESLTKATEEELLVAWKGLGYYRRARSLKKIAEVIVNEHGGKFPKEADTLQQITGIGPYTSEALVAIGMDKRGLAIDANLERVISRIFGFKEVKGPKLQVHIQQQFRAGKIFKVANISYRALNEALMDLGRTYCQARKASCDLCPLKEKCIASRRGEPLKFPFPGTNIKAKAVDHELQLLRLFITKGKKLLVFKKTEKEWLAGQYEVPTFVLSTTDKSLRQYPTLPNRIDVDKSVSYVTGITKYKITNFALKAEVRSLSSLGFDREVEWREISDETSNLSTATLKGLKKLLLFTCS